MASGIHQWEAQITGVVICEDIINESLCIASGCYWYDGACHSTPPDVVCADYETESLCLAVGCYWYDGACHSEPKPVPPVAIPWGLIVIGGIAVAIGTVLVLRR